MKTRRTAVSDDAKTEKQWAKLGMKPKKNENGTRCWSNGFCNQAFTYFEPEQVEKMTGEEIADFKDIAKEQRRKQKQAQKEKQEEFERMCEENNELHEVYHTAFQWLELDRIVIDSNLGTIGRLLNSSRRGGGFADDYLYYHISNTIEDKEKATELQGTFPQGTDFFYRGQPWWGN